MEGKDGASFGRTRPIDIENVTQIDTTEHKSSDEAGAVRGDDLDSKQASEYLKSLKTLQVEKVAVLSFRELQLRRMGKLQNELLELQNEAGDELNQRLSTKIDDALIKYATALQNYETLSQNTLPLVPPGSRLLGSLDIKTDWPEPNGAIARWLINLTKTFPRLDIIIIQLQIFTNIMDIYGMFSDDTWSITRTLMALIAVNQGPELQKTQSRLGQLGFRELDQKGRLERMRKRAFSERLVMEVFGGIALIGPMLIMTLLPAQKTSLITTSVATFLFAFVLAVSAKASKGKDVLSATTAYAAVLVVFVGASNTSS